MPIYMQIDGIEGESHSDTHTRWFDVMSFSWGETNSGHAGGGGGGAGRVSMSEFTVTKNSGKGSPLLFLNCANGHHIAHVVVEVTRANSDQEVVVERFTLSNCLISSYDIGGDGGSAPVETLSFNFTRIEFRQQFVGVDGSVDFQDNFWDLATNRGG